MATRMGLTSIRVLLNTESNAYKNHQNRFGVNQWRSFSRINSSLGLEKIQVNTGREGGT